MLVAVGHAVWGLFAYREPLEGLVRAGVLDSVGDGIFRVADAQSPGAAAFWFMFVAPLLGLCGYLVEVADRADDRRALTVTGGAVLGLGAIGTAIIPRSGFPTALPIGLWIVRRGRR
jgi:hypothetical protein